MPSWDYRCPNCGVVQTFVFRNAEERDRTMVTCDPDGPCDGHSMERLASAPNFTISGYTAKNGYSHANDRR